MTSGTIMTIYFIGLNLGDWSELGQAIGGVIGTFLTFIVGIVVYITYRTQKEQLEQQKKQANQMIIDTLYDRIVKEIEDMEIKQDFTQTIYKGTSVLFNLNFLIHTQNTIIGQLNLILISCEHLFKLTEDSNYKWNLQKEINKDRNYLMFYSKIIWPIHRFYLEGWDKLITNFDPPHPDSLGMKARFEKLLRETYLHLLKEDLVGRPDSVPYNQIIDRE